VPTRLPFKEKRKDPDKMTQEKHEKTAVDLATKMLEAYKWEVISRRAVAMARLKTSKQGAWLAFAAWAQKKHKESDDRQAEALCEFEQSLLCGDC
jgi:hypothetical protein